MTAGTLPWFASHELRLAWRDWLSMMTAGRRGREKVVAVALAIFVIFAHVLAWYFVARYVEDSATPSKSALVVITGSLVLAWSLLISQAMESVTRAFYARSDLDLILSSPAAARKIFAVRIAAMALSVILMAALLGAPLINVLVARGGVRWLGSYGVVVAMGATAVQSLMGKAASITSLRGKKLELPDGAALLVTVHPSYLLRIPEADRKAEELERFEADLRAVKTFIDRRGDEVRRGGPLAA